MGYAITSPAEKPRRRTTSSSQKTASGDFFALTEKSSLKNLCNPLKPRQGNTATPTKTASGVLYEHYRYTAFGEPEIYTPTGSKLATSAIDNTVLWNSRRYDVDTNLYYYKYRHYKADIGRWLSRDPIEDMYGIKWLHRTGYNTYAFVGNQPLFWWDKLGLQFEEGEGWWGADPGLQDAMDEWVDNPGKGGSICGLIELYKAYRDMKDHNTPGADEYYHCLGFCKAKKKCGVDLKRAGALKELIDLAKYAMRDMKGNDGNPMSVDEMLEDIKGDFENNQQGRECADDKRGCHCCCKEKYPNGAP